MINLTRIAAGAAIAILLGLAVWGVVAALRAIYLGIGHGFGFWAANVLILLLARAALWLAATIYRRVFVKRDVKLS